MAWPETMETLNTGVVAEELFGVVVPAQNAFEQRIAVLNTNEKNSLLAIGLWSIDIKKIIQNT